MGKNHDRREEMVAQYNAQRRERDFVMVEYRWKGGTEPSHLAALVILSRPVLSNFGKLTFGVVKFDGQSEPVWEYFATEKEARTYLASLT